MSNLSKLSRSVATALVGYADTEQLIEPAPMPRTTLSRTIAAALVAYADAEEGEGGGNPFLSLPVILGTAGAGAVYTAQGAQLAAGFSHHAFTWRRTQRVEGMVGRDVGYQIATGDTYTASASGGGDDGHAILLVEEVRDLSGNSHYAVSLPVQFSSLTIWDVDFTSYPADTNVAGRYVTDAVPNVPTAFSPESGGIEHAFVWGDLTFGSHGDPTMLGLYKTSAEGIYFAKPDVQQVQVSLVWDAGEDAYQISFDMPNNGARYMLGFSHLGNNPGNVGFVKYVLWMGQNEGQTRNGGITLVDTDSGGFQPAVSEAIGHPFKTNGTSIVTIRVDTITSRIDFFVDGQFKTSYTSPNSGGMNRLFGFHNWGVVSPNTPLFKKLKLERASAAQPLVVTNWATVEDTASGYQKVKLIGEWTGTDPSSGMTAEVFDPDGRPVMAAEPVTIDSVTAGATGGGFTVTMASPLVLSLQGRRPTIVLRKTAAPDEATSFAQAYTEYRPAKTFGMNSGGFTGYGGRDGIYRDWRQALDLWVDAGPYRVDNSNNNVSFYVYEKMLADGIIDRDMNLLQWPTGATTVGIWLRRVPAVFEIQPRLLNLPPQQDISLSLEARQKGITLAKDLTTGQHIVTFPQPAAGASPDFDNSSMILIDEASFVAWTGAAGGRWSFRRVGDDSPYRLYDEFIAVTSRFGVWRGMDANGANLGGRWASFDDRIDWGWCIEDDIENANRATCRPWFVPGHRASATEIAKFVAFAEAHINPEITVFHGDTDNEQWNAGLGPRFAFARDSLYSPRAYKDAQGRLGYGSPPPIEKVHDFSSKGDFTLAKDAAHPDGRPGYTTEDVAAGDYIIGNRYGFNMLCWKAKQFIPAGTYQPPYGAPGYDQLSDDYFQFVAEAQPDLEYGFRVREAVLACKPVSTRMQWSLNMAPDPGQFDKAQAALHFAATPGGNDTLLAVIESVAIAPYIDWWQPSGGVQAILDMPAGPARVTAIGDQLALSGAYQVTVPQSTHRWLRDELDGAGRGDHPTLVHCYEGGQQTFYPGPVPQAFLDDLVTYCFSERRYDLAVDYYSRTLANGVTTFCAYSFGPGYPTGSSFDFDFAHATSLNDTTSAAIRADYRIADHLKLGTPL